MTHEEEPSEGELREEKKVFCFLDGKGEAGQNCKTGVDVDLGDLCD